jgi:stage II sporulation protein M
MDPEESPGFKRGLSKILTVFAIFTFVGMLLVLFVPHSGDVAVAKVQISPTTNIISGAKELGTPFYVASLFLSNLVVCVVVAWTPRVLKSKRWGSLVVYIIVALQSLTIGGLFGVLSTRFNPLFAVATLFPHGLFEVPGYLLAATIGITFAGEWDEFVIGGPTGKDFFRLFVRTIIPLLLLGAIVEIFITPVLMLQALQILR